MNNTRLSIQKTLLPITLVAISSMLVTAPVAQAQDAQLEQEQDVQLEEVIVIARKVVESGQDVPIAISAFSGGVIDDMVMRDIREIEGLIPNLVIDTVSVAPAGSSIYIRGVGTQEVERTFDPAVGVVIDGVALSYVSGSLVNTFDIAGVEVLRGPQGTLFGRNTTGGVINVTHTRPSGKMGLKYELTGGSNSRIDLKAVLNFPIIAGVLAGKLGYASMQKGGQQTNIFNDQRVGDFDNQEITGTLLWTPTDMFEALFIYTNYKDENDGIPLQNIAQPGVLTCTLGHCLGQLDIDKVNQDSLNPIDFKMDAYNLTMNWEFKMGTLTSVTGYRDTNESVPTDFDATPVDVFRTLRIQQSEQTSTELRFASSEALSKRWDFVLGVYYLNDEYQLEQFTSITAFLSPAKPTESGAPGAVFLNPHVDHGRQAWSIFNETHIALHERLNLTLGGRYTREKKDITADNFLALGLPEGYFRNGAVTADDSWSEFTPKAGLDYRLHDDVLLYLSYAEGFRSGGYNGRNYKPEDIGPYNPEFVKQAELGMKSDLFNRRLRINLAAFTTDYDDKQEEVILPDGLGSTITVVRNAATVGIWGLEGELSWAATAGLVINTNFGYLKAEYDNYIADLNGDGTATDNSALELRRVPSLTGGINGNYTRQIGLGALNAFASYRYTGKYQTHVSNNPLGLLDSRGVIDVSISYEWAWGANRTAKITAFGRDLTDEQRSNSAVIIPGFFSFAGVSGGVQYGLQVSGSF